MGSHREVFFSEAENDQNVLKKIILCLTRLKQWKNVNPKICCFSWRLRRALSIHNWAFFTKSPNKTTSIHNNSPNLKFLLTERVLIGFLQFKHWKKALTTSFILIRMIFNYIQYWWRSTILNFEVKKETRKDRKSNFPSSWTNIDRILTI